MSGEIETSKKVVLKQRYMEHSSKLHRLTSLSINDWVENYSPHSRRIDDTIVSYPDWHAKGGVSPHPVTMGGHMRSRPCVCKPFKIRRSGRGRCRESTCIAGKLSDLGYSCSVLRL